MKTFTVLILRPDYEADAFGEDTILDFVMANDVADAQRIAQDNAWSAGQDVPDRKEFYGQPDDYVVLCVFAGQQFDIKEDR